MFDLRKLIFGEPDKPLAPALAEALRAWAALPAPDLDRSHFDGRYVLVDIATTGPKPERDAVVSIAALALERGGRLSPEGAFCVELTDGSGNVLPTVDAQLVAFLQFVGKDPLVTYHSGLVLGFLKPLLRQRLGVEPASRDLDLAWLLPSMFGEVSPQAMPLDDWLQHFSGEIVRRRDPMSNAVELARLFQRLLVRAIGRDIDTMALLLDESSASSFLRRNH